MNSAKKLLLPCCIALFAVQTQAQSVNAGAEKTKPRDFRLGLNVSPDLSYRRLAAADSLFIDIRNRFETPGIGYHAGLNLYWGMRNHFSFESGLHFATHNFRLVKTRLVFTRPDPSFPQTNPAEPIYARGVFKAHYLDIPLRFNYSLGEGPLSIIFGFGFNANILLQETHKSIFYHDGQREIRGRRIRNDYQRLNISSALSAGFNYRFSDKWNFRLEPSFRYGLFGAVKNPERVRQNLYSAGLNLGCYLTL